jgi:dihydropteroate synthase
MAAVLWKIAGQTYDFSQRAMIMGVLNVTPDSFSDGGQFFDRAAAVEQGTRMIAEGADIIDIGGESTRPGADEVAEQDELRRVVPVIETLAPAIGGKLISIDTMKAGVARVALRAGAKIINDVTGGRCDAEMMPLAAESGAGFIIMHMQGTPRTMQTNPQYDDVVSEVAEFFRQQYACALLCGIDPMTIAFDPGIGFGKTLQHNLELLRNLSRLRVEDRPLVVGVSRKSFLGKAIDSPELADRVAPTIATTALIRDRGADVIRVHDVKPNVAALRVTEALLQTTTA